MAGKEIVVRGPDQAPAQGLAGDTGPAGPGARAPAVTTTTAPQPVQLVDAQGRPAKSGSPGLEGPLLVAFVGAVIAQTLAATIAHRFKRRDAETSAFDHAFKTGMVARRKTSRYVDWMARPREDMWEMEPRQSFVDALTDFRAAVALYAAFDSSSPVTQQLETARDVFGDWPTADPSEEEIDDAMHEEMERASYGDYDFGDSMRVRGNELHEALTKAVAAFSERSQRPLWRR